MFIIAFMVFFIAVIICGIIDYKKYIIPNIITVPLIIAGLIIQTYHQNWTNVLFALTVGFVVLALAAITGGIGGGDVKLITALFLWSPLPDCLNIIIASSLIGIVWGVVKKIKVNGFARVNYPPLKRQACSLKLTSLS